jgi:RNA:NAD 2'-phosphotransferase (TPT1/KptA family)
MEPRWESDGSCPAIIVVDAVAAHADGVRCFASGPLFLAENVPFKCLSLDQK